MKYSSVLNNKLFVKTHFRASKHENPSPTFISHRCSQWISDLKSDKRNQSLMIQDLELACEIMNEPASVVLKDPRYFFGNIEYVSEEFLSLIQKTQDQPRADNTLENIFFPICSDPATGTMMYACVVEAKNKLPNQFDASGRALKTYRLKYIVYSLHVAVETFEGFSIENKEPSAVAFFDYQEALKQYTSISRYERNCKMYSGLGYQLEKLIRKLMFYFSEKDQKAAKDMVNQQKLYYGFYPDLLQKYAAPDDETKSSLSQIIFASSTK